MVRTSAVSATRLLATRTLASAALFFFVLLDEIEGFAFVSLGIIAHRIDLFVEAQSVLFPLSIVVAAAATAFFFWRRRERVAELPIEAVDAQTLFERIGVTPKPAAPASGAKWRRALR